jgi:putative spermidine/putrescine transport system permease protein
VARLKQARGGEPYAPEGWARWLLLALSFPALFLSITPIVYALIWAVAGTQVVGVLHGFSLKWFQALWQEGGWLESIALSLVLAVVSASVSLALAAMLGYYSKWGDSFGGNYASSFILLPLLFPSVVYALALQFVLGRSGIPTFLGVALGHVVTILPIQCLVIRSGHGRFSPTQLWAASTMGAPPLHVINKAYLPAMAKPLVMAWALGALVSFDELVIAVFVWDYLTEPVPKRLWSLFGRASEPLPAVISIVVLALLLSVALISYGVIRLRRRRN